MEQKVLTPPVTEVEIPIRSVVLYKHGVAYFERQGTVNNDAKINLFFKSSDMNDVLKSLTALDLNGGLISSVSYAANRSVSDQLNDIMLQIPEEHSLTGLFNQCKGAKVQVVTNENKEMEGVILGTQMFCVRENEVDVAQQHLSLLVNGCKMVTLSVTELKSIAFQEEHLRKDIQHLLNVLIGAKKKDSKQLTIHAAGDGERTLYLSYTVAAPLWKTSYRFLLADPHSEQKNDNDDKKKEEVVVDDDKKKKKDAKSSPPVVPECIVQGWAMVDNVTDEDWNHVKLSLVSGLPVSFIHDLYNPRYKKRPIVEVNDQKQAYGAPLLGSADSNMPAFKSLSSLNRAPSTSSTSRLKDQQPVIVRNVEAGDLFHYEIKHAVTVKRNGAALVPFFSGKTQCERLLVYNPSVRNKNPMSSLLIKNTTGVALEGGPVTVTEDDCYVGEAMLDTLRPNEEKMLPYSVELGVVINSENTSESKQIHEVHISSGTMLQWYWNIIGTTYHINNKTDKKQILVIEHRFQPNHELFETPDYFEKTANFYRFKIASVEPRSSCTFVVREKLLSNKVEHLSNVNDDLIQVWLRSTFIDKEMEAKLQELVQISKKKQALTEQANDCKKEIDTITQGQARIRENLKVLGESDGQELRTRYLNRLGAEEDKLQQLNCDRTKFSDEVAKLVTDFQKKLQGLSYRKKL